MRRCQYVCPAPAVSTIVIEHPTTGPVFSDRCAEHETHAAYPIVSVMPLGTTLALVPRSIEQRPLVSSIDPGALIVGAIVAVVLACLVIWLV